MSKCKTIHKPWGKEEWLELNDKYCYKRIYVNAGTKTSFQYHEKKLETNYLIEGKAELWLENDEGIIEKTIIAPGYLFILRESIESLPLQTSSCRKFLLRKSMTL